MARRMLTAAALALISLSGLSACRTTEEVEQERSARLEAWQGSTMAQFMGATGMTPVDAYPISSGKVFVFEGSTIVSTLPATQWTPAVSRASACRLLISARLGEGGAGGTADGWVITGTSRSGPCASLPI